MLSAAEQIASPLLQSTHCVWRRTCPPNLKAAPCKYTEKEWNVNHSVRDGIPQCFGLNKIKLNLKWKKNRWKMCVTPPVSLYCTRGYWPVFPEQLVWPLLTGGIHTGVFFELASEMLTAVLDRLPGQRQLYVSSSAHSCPPDPPPYETAGHSSLSADGWPAPPTEALRREETHMHTLAENDRIYSWAIEYDKWSLAGWAVAVLESHLIAMKHNLDGGSGWRMRPIGDNQLAHLGWEKCSQCSILVMSYLGFVVCVRLGGWGGAPALNMHPLIWDIYKTFPCHNRSN